MLHGVHFVLWSENCIRIIGLIQELGRCNLMKAGHSRITPTVKATETRL